MRLENFCEPLLNKTGYNFYYNYNHDGAPATTLKTAEMEIFKSVPDAKCLVLVRQVSF